MTGFRILLAIVFATIAVYTVFVIADHGIGLFTVFFGDIGKLAWPGQFNLDFLGMLMLSGFYLAWRHQFSPAGLGLGVLGLLGGAPVLTLYLLIMSFRADGDVRRLLLGDARAA